jgi:hypothetical protein
LYPWIQSNSAFVENTSGKEIFVPGGKHSGIGVLGDPCARPDLSRHFLKNAILLRNVIPI